MKKFLLASLALICIFCGVLTAGCQNEYHYYIDDSAFSLVVALNDDIDSAEYLKDLYICRVQNKETVRTQVTPSMIKSCDQTNTIGEKNLTLSYDDRDFVVKFMVKYKVNFMVEDNVISSQFVLSPDEIEYPNSPSVEGVNFSGWSPIKPTELTNNLTFNAVFALKESDLPVPTALSATYGDTLKSLSLRSNSKGSWQFVDDLSTTVGDAGTNEFEIKFVPTNTDLVPPVNRKIKVNVQKKHVDFSNVTESFVYDGTAKQPTYTLSVSGLDTEYYPEYAGEAINVNSYDYEIVIKDKNHEGRYRGSFAIQKRVVTIKIASEEINYTDSLPETYDFQVVDSKNNSLDNALVNLMGIQLIKPTDNYAGAHVVDAMVTNSNFDVKIEKGYLFINKIHYDLTEANPTFINNGNVTYGNYLNSVEINNAVETNGWWAFEDNGLQVLTAKSFTTNVIYTSTDTNYLPTTKQITLNVLQRPLQIDVLQNVYTYDGNPHTLVYEVKGVLSHDEQPTVIGNIQKTNAKLDGYATTLKIDTDKYIAQTNATLTIRKAKQADFSTVYAYTWNDLLQLQHILINSGYTWDKPTTDIDDIGLQGFNATYTPVDTENYEIERGILQVNIAKAQAEIQTNQAYSITYSPNKNDYVLAGIFASHNESTLIYSYKYEGVIVEELKDAGNYTITLTLPESTHYLEATKTFDVIVNKVNNTDNVKTSVNATYLDTLSQTVLPTNDFGVWSWSEGGDCLVGYAGVNYHTAIYTPFDTKNYNSKQINVTFNVAKKTIITPTITAQDYTGATLYADIQSTILYDVTLNGGDVEVGTYDVKLQLTDPNNYVWSTSDNSSVIVDFEIKKNMNNDWVDLPTVTGCTYDLGEVKSSASSIFGDVVITYANEQTPTIISTTKPTEAGSYIVTFSVADTKNYKGLNETKKFEILPQTVAVPTINSSVYSGENQTANISNAELYIITENNGGKDVGVYDVVLQLNDSHNYVWSTTNNGEDLTLDFVITQAENVWETSPKITNSEDNKTITYLDELKLTAVPKFNAEKTVTYVLKGSTEEPTVIQPTDAGNYTAYLTIAGTDNFTKLTGSVDFTILPKSVECPAIDFAYYDGENKQTALNSTSLYNVTQEIVDSQVIENGYPVVFALVDNHNYIWDNGSHENITKAFFINQNPNGWTTIPNVEYITYGATPSPVAVQQFGTLKTVTYTIKDTNTVVTPVNAGSYTAHFEVEGNNNYAGLTASVDFIIKPQVVTLSEITPVFYSGALQKANVSALEGVYTVENEGGINAGSYDVIFTLEDYGNYIWPDSTVQETLVLPFVINQNPTNDWKTSPAIKNSNNQAVIYGDKIMEVGASTFGTLNPVQYKLLGADDSTLTTTQPTDAGKYTAVFSVTATDDYVGNKKYVDFTIGAKEVIKPIAGTKTYNGYLQLSDITSLEGVYKVIQQGGVEATKQGYPVYVELLSDNYIWNGENAETREITLWFKITQEESNEWITKPSVTNSKNETIINYLDELKTTAAAKYGEVEILFINRDIVGDAGTTTTPINAGNYIALFSVAETESYAGLDAVSINFTINPSIITVPEETSTTYDGSPQKANTTDGVFYKVTKNNEYIDAGVYYVDYTILDEYYGNYVWGENIAGKVASVQFKILKNDYNNWKTSNAPKVTNAQGQTTITYGDTISATAQATYAHEDVVVKYALTGSNDEPTATVPTTVGAYTAYFISAGNNNYKEVTGSVDFVILPKPVVCPENAGSKVYNAEEQTTELSNEYYTVTQTVTAIDVNVEGYSVVLSLKDTTNYIWDDSTIEDKTIKFYITQATNGWEIEPSITNAENETTIIYLDTLKTTAEAKFGELNNVIYTIKGTNTIVVPENAGQYTAHFSVTETDNYKDIAATVDFTILPQEVATPENAGSKVYNKGAQTTSLSHDLYNVTQTEEAINVKAEGYAVTLSLKDKTNYIWEDSNSDDVTVKFYITQATNIWNTNPSVANALNMDYGDVIVFNKGSTTFGEIQVKYLDANKDEVAEAKNAGIYYMVFFVETDEYGNYTNLSQEVEIKISPKVVDKPTISSKEYTGKTLTASVTIDENTLYTIKTNDGGINVTQEGYPVVLELIDAHNYCWARDDASATTTLTFKIDQSVNSWITSPRIDNVGKISYSDVVQTTAVAKHGTPIVTYTLEGATTELTQPGNVGTYTVTFKIAGNANYTGLLETRTITVYPKEVEIPSFNSELTYTGEVVTPVIADVEGDGYVVSSSSNVNVGTYTITFALESTTNFVWANDEGTQPQSFEYNINPATDNGWTKTIPNDIGWAYTPTPTAPVIYSKYGTATIWFKLKDADDSTYTTTVPKQSGSYTAKLQDLGSTNYNATEAITRDCTISKANAFVEKPIYNGVFYENIIDLSNDYTTAPGLVSTYDEQVGTFTYSKWTTPVIHSGAAEYATAYASVTYTPKDPENSNYVTYTYTDVPVNIKLVAYNGSNYYGLVDTALQKTTSGQVIVRPDITGNVTISTNNLEVKSGVELVLPYTGDNGLVTSIGDGTGTLKTTKAIDNLVLHTKLVIKAGVTLTNKGTITIAGEISGGGGGHGMAGNTAGKYAKIVLENNAHIESTGTINCFGFIDELDLNNGSSVEVRSGTVNMPFVVDDHNGGTFMAACKNSGYMPFMQWELRNVMTEITYHYGSKLVMHANLCARKSLFNSQNVVHHTTGNFIGTSDAFVNIANKGFITCKYNVSEEDAQQNPDHEKIYNGITQIDFYGGATVNALSLKIVGNTIKTSDYYFPLTWRQSLSFNATSNGATYTINNKYDMLPGSKVVVGKGAEVEVGSLRVYSTYTGYSVNGKDCQYGYNYKEEELNLDPAELIVYGKLTAKTMLAGNVQTRYVAPEEGETYEQPVVVINEGCTTSTTANSVATISSSSILSSVKTSYSYELTLSLTGGSTPVGHVENVTTYKFDGTDWVPQTS